MENDLKIQKYLADCGLMSRRAAEKDINVLTRKMSDVMTVNPKAVNSEALAVEVVRLVEKHKISDIIVIDDDRKVVGLIDVQDLPGLKLM